ncbi:MAG: NADH-quinone oxidoreductase subunit C [Nitrospira sp.]
MSAVGRYIHTDPGLRGSLSLLWAVDHRPREFRDKLWYLFTLAEHKDWLLLAVNLARGGAGVCVDHSDGACGEVVRTGGPRSLFGLIPVGHPDMRRLVRHEHWPKRSHPLKKEFVSGSGAGARPGEIRFQERFMVTGSSKFLSDQSTPESSSLGISGFR